MSDDDQIDNVSEETDNTPDEQEAPKEQGTARRSEPQEPERETAHEFNAITSQEAFDKAVGARLAKERAKYAGYEDLKAKATKFDELQDANKTETERLQSRAEAAERERDQLKRTHLISDLATDAGLPKKFWKRVSGETREEIEADIADLLDGMPKPAEPAPPKQPVAITTKPRENLRGGGTPDEEPEETDPLKLADLVPRSRLPR